MWDDVINDSENNIIDIIDFTMTLFIYFNFIL